MSEKKLDTSIIPSFKEANQVWSEAELKNKCTDEILIFANFFLFL